MGARIAILKPLGKLLSLYYYPLYSSLYLTGEKKSRYPASYSSAMGWSLWLRHSCRMAGNWSLWFPKISAELDSWGVIGCFIEGSWWWARIIGHSREGEITWRDRQESWWSFYRRKRDYEACSDWICVKEDRSEVEILIAQHVFRGWKVSEIAGLGNRRSVGKHLGTSTNTFEDYVRKKVKTHGLPPEANIDMQLKQACGLRRYTLPTIQYAQNHHINFLYIPTNRTLRSNSTSHLPLLYIIPTLSSPQALYKDWTYKNNQIIANRGTVRLVTFV